MRISLMAGSGNGAAALARALDRVLQTASGPAAVSRLPHCAARQIVVIPRKESVLLPKPWQACLRGFSDSNCGDSGPGKNDGELQNRRPEDIGRTAHPSGTPGGNLEGPQWANEPVARGGQSSAAVNGRRFASTPAIGFQKPSSSFGSAGISKAQHAFPNSEGPVDFGSRLSKLSEDDLDNLIAFKNFKGIRGLPPLETILAQDDEQEKRAKRREAERRKQEETKRSRVKQVDAFGRAYATGKRKTSIARVWLKEGQGDIIINGKSHDLYFLDMDKRVQLLEPFVITHTLGAFDVKSTVKGGGVSGQSGALRHGISKALQLFDPALRPALKSEGMLTRDDRIVERKKPGKAKARKSFQWVKR